MQITFKSDGTAQHVGDNSLLQGSIARATKKRASRILPVNPALRAAFWIARAAGLAEWSRGWPCLWQVSIIGGPVLPKLYRDRAEAIKDEISYLEERL